MATVRIISCIEGDVLLMVGSARTEDDYHHAGRKVKERLGFWRTNPPWSDKLIKTSRNNNNHGFSWSVPLSTQRIHKLNGQRALHSGSCMRAMEYSFP